MSGIQTVSAPRSTVWNTNFCVQTTRRVYGIQTICDQTTIREFLESRLYAIRQLDASVWNRDFLRSANRSESLESRLPARGQADVSGIQTISVRTPMSGIQTICDQTTKLECLDQTTRRMSGIHTHHIRSGGERKAIRSSGNYQSSETHILRLFMKQHDCIRSRPRPLPVRELHQKSLSSVTNENQFF